VSTAEKLMVDPLPIPDAASFAPSSLNRRAAAARAALRPSVHASPSVPLYLALNSFLI
jgi:hypothetical protein